MKQRGSRHLDTDLAWYFDEAEGECGKHGVALEPQRGGQHDGVSERQEKATTRMRRIEAVLHRLPHATQRTLRLGHTLPMPADRARLAVFGDVARYVVGTCDCEALARLLVTATTRSKDRTARDKARADIAFLKREAGAAVALAIQAYRDAKWERDRAESRAKATRVEARAKARIDGVEA